MQKAQTCSECGSPIPENARAGYCPKCLLALGEFTLVVEAAEPQLASPLPPNSPGSWFGSYELIEQIGEGGMGVVYKARQRTLNRIVALKMMRSGSLASESEVKRFRSEAQAVARLQHPNVVAIHEVGEQDGQFFFSMDYIEGKSLAEVIQQAPSLRMMACDLMPWAVNVQMGLSLTDYVGGKVDLDTALKQIDDAWAASG